MLPESVPTRTNRLRSVLLDHAPADALEARHRDRMLELLGTVDPFGRDHFVPGHFTASAFVGSPDGASLLLILHAKLGLWLQPGGVDVVAAARREVAEETGLSGDSVTTDGDGLLDVDIHGIPPNPRKGEPGHEHFDVRVLLRAQTLELAAGSDALAARWVRLEDVEDAGTDDSVLRAVRKLLARRVRGS